MRLFTSFTLTLTTVIIFSSWLQAGPLVFSTHSITLSPQKRVGSILVHNPNDQAQRFRVSFIDNIMTETGDIAQISQDDSLAIPKHSATRWMISTPRTLRLGPKQSQKIRVLARRPKNLAEGEYRTQLYLEELPLPNILQKMAGKEKAKEGISLHLLYNTSLPVYVQQGKTQSSATIRNLERTNQGKTFTCLAERSGNATFYGMLLIQGQDNESLRVPLAIYRERQAIIFSTTSEALEKMTPPWTIQLYQGQVLPDGQRPLQTLTLAN